MKLIKFLLLIFIIAGAFACIEDTIQVEDLSTEIEFEREIALPLLKGSLSFDDFAGHGYDSLIITSGDTIFLYLLENIALEDTVEKNEINIEFDYINLYYKITNMFPVGLDMKIYLYDSISGSNIDTVLFSNNPDSLFIQPAPSDANGLTLEDQVTTDIGSISLNENVLYNMFHVATHWVLYASIPSTGGFVKILRTNRFAIKLGVEARGTFINKKDSTN